VTILSKMLRFNRQHYSVKDLDKAEDAYRQLKKEGHALNFVAIVDDTKTLIEVFSDHYSTCKKCQKDLTK
jgi:hypothetical protein